MTKLKIKAPEKDASKHTAKIAVHTTTKAERDDGAAAKNANPASDALLTFRKKVDATEIREHRTPMEFEEIVYRDLIYPPVRHLLAAACEIAHEGGHLTRFSDAAKTIAYTGLLRRVFIDFEDARTDELKNECFKLVEDYQEHPADYKENIQGVNVKALWEQLADTNMHCPLENNLMECLPKPLLKRLDAGIVFALTKGFSGYDSDWIMKKFWRQFTLREIHIIHLYTIYEWFTYPVDEMLDYLNSILGDDYGMNHDCRWRYEAVKSDIA